MDIPFAPPPPVRKIRHLLIPVLGSIQEFHASLSRPINYVWISNTIKLHFDEPFEHVAVLYEGQRRDMFVGETSAINGRHIRNVRATEIYRNNALVNGWERDPESMPAISGPAVLFPDYQVWR